MRIINLQQLRKSSLLKKLNRIPIIYYYILKPPRPHRILDAYRHPNVSNIQPPSPLPCLASQGARGAWRVAREASEASSRGQAPLQSSLRPVRGAPRILFCDATLVTSNSRGTLYNRHFVAQYLSLLFCDS